MLIILEGTDLAGKTTLATRLQTYLAVKYPRHTVTLLHRGPPAPGTHPLDEYVQPLLDYVPGGNEHVICDRWHWGEYVYPEVKRRRTKMTPGIFDYVEMFLKMRGAVTVHVTAPIAVLVDRYARRGDDYVTLGDLRPISEGFQLAENESITGYRPTSSTPEHIADVARFAEQRAARFTRFVTPVGQMRPDVLLLGDVRASLKRGERSTAFMPYPATSGHYLTWAIRAAGIPELRRNATIANACDVDDVEALYLELCKPAVVALGERAHRSLGGIPHAVVPHPQYVRRFHYARAAEYGRLIWQVAGTEGNEIGWMNLLPRRAGWSTQVSSPAF